MTLHFSKTLKNVDNLLITWMGKHAITILRVNLGIIFLWFGFLKFIPGASPAQSLAGRTIEVLSFGLIQPQVSLVTLAVWETLIGLGLISGRYLRLTLFLLFTQMLGTLTPLLLFPAETFVNAPLAPTLEGQYIIKNLVLIAAGLVIGSSLQKNLTESWSGPSNFRS
jgi:uncharacterized membrane protein YphA (DoxX/SURF4 family)